MNEAVIRIWHCFYTMREQYCRSWNSFMLLYQNGKGSSSQKCALLISTLCMEMEKICGQYVMSGWMRAELIWLTFQSGLFVLSYSTILPICLWCHIPVISIANVWNKCGENETATSSSSTQRCLTAQLLNLSDKINLKAFYKHHLESQHNLRWDLKATFESSELVPKATDQHCLKMMGRKLADVTNICLQCNLLNPVLSASSYTERFLVYTSVHYTALQLTALLWYNHTHNHVFVFFMYLCVCC